MNIISKIKHTVLLALFIALIPVPAHAGFMDNAWSFIKQNTATLATAAVGLLCCGLVWWKKNNDIEKLRADKDAALARLHATKELEKRNALNSFATQAEAQFIKNLEEERRKVAPHLTQEQQKIDKLAKTTAQLKAQYIDLRQKRIAAQKLPYDVHELNVLFSNAQNVFDRVEYATAHQNDRESVSAPTANINFKGLLTELEHIKERLETLAQIASGSFNYGALEKMNIDLNQLYQSYNLTPELGAMMACEGVRYTIESLYDENSDQEEEGVDQVKKDAVLDIFKNEFSKKHFDLYLKGAQYVNNWILVIRANQWNINQLLAQAAALHRRLENIVRNAETYKKALADRLQSKVKHNTDLQSGAASLRRSTKSNARSISLSMHSEPLPSKPHSSTPTKTK